MQPVGDDDVHHGQDQGGVGAGIDGDPLVGDGGGGAHTGVNHDDSRAGLLSLSEEADGGGNVVGDVAAEEDHELGVGEVEGIVAGVRVAGDHGEALGGGAVAHDALGQPQGAAQAGAHAGCGEHAQQVQVAGEVPEGGVAGVVR